MRIEMNKKIIKWFVTESTGVSSKAIVAQLMDIDRRRRTWGDHPHDSDDFGRCYRLLEAVPEFKPRISEIAVRSSEWSALVEYWDELTTLYAEDGRCYERIKEILATAKDKKGADLGGGITLYD
jgi:hypothetical protein